MLNFLKHFSHYSISLSMNNGPLLLAGRHISSGKNFYLNPKSYIRGQSALLVCRPQPRNSPELMARGVLAPHKDSDHFVAETKDQLKRLLDLAVIDSFEVTGKLRSRKILWTRE